MYFIKFFAIFFIYTSMCSVKSKRVLQLNNHNTQPHPEIWNSGYRKADSIFATPADSQFRFHDNFVNEFVSKHGSDYVITEETVEVFFTCEADYSIEWETPFPEQLQYLKYLGMDSVYYRISTFGPNDPEPISNHFKSTISFKTSQAKFLSLNLTCSSTNQPVLKSSIYIYLTGEMELEHDGETLQISLNRIPADFHPIQLKSHPPLILPCRPARPDMSVALEKEIVELKTHIIADPHWWRLHPEDEHLTFDPKIGFTVDRGVFGDMATIFGLYRCTVFENEEEFSQDNVDNKDAGKYLRINVTVAPGEKFDSKNNKVIAQNEIDIQPRSILHGKASVTLREYENYTNSLYPGSNVICCSGVEKKPPKLYVKSCSDLFTCQVAKKTIFEAITNLTEDHPIAQHRYYSPKIMRIPSDCSKQHMYSAGMIIVCQGENVDFVDVFVDLIHPLAGNAVKNRSTRVLKASPPVDLKNVPITMVPRITSLTQYISSDNAKTADVSRKIIIIVGQNASAKKDGRFHLEQPIYFNFIDHYNNSDVVTIDILNSENRHQISLVEYPRDEYYEGETMIFMCLGVKYFYADGSQFRLNWKNGSKTLVERSEDNGARNSRDYRVYLSDRATMSHGHGNSEFIPFFGRSVIASQDIMSVDCWMPHKDSEKWDKITKEIIVLPSVAPKFRENEDEIIYFHLGEIGNHISCTITGGLPLPDFKVTRNGRDQRIISQAANYSHNKNKIEGLTNGEIETERTKADKNETIIRINFAKISHQHQGVFQCSASNVNKTITRTVKVIVTEKSKNGNLYLSISVVGILCLVLIGLGAWHWYGKKIVTTLRLVNI